MTRLQQQLCFPLYAASRQVIAAYTPLLAPYQLTYLQYLCLMVLWDQDGQKVNELGEKLYLDSGTLTPLLSKLEKRGLISRVREGREVFNWLTEQGWELEKKLAHLPCQLKHQLPLNQTEAQQLYELLYILLTKGNQGTGTEDETTAQ